MAITAKRYPRVYALLKRAGHSPVKAAEVVIAARRGEVHAIEWIVALFAWRSNTR